MALTDPTTEPITSPDPLPVEAPSNDRYERPSPLWYALIDPGLASTAVLALSPRAYAFASARLPLPPRRIVQAIAVGALAIHVAEAASAYRTAKAAGMHRTAPRWAVETFVVGFPSLLQLHKVAAS